MRNNQIVEELRKKRDALAAEFDYGLEAMAGFLTC